MKLFFILGNQLFPPKYLDRYKNDHLFFMAEDLELCTYEKHHKLKILLFLSSMRSHSDELKKNKLKIEYSDIENKEFGKSYTEKLKKIIKSKKINEVTSFEVEDKFFEIKLTKFFNSINVKWNVIKTPMFLNSRQEFDAYLNKNKKPFMATFYKETRKKLNILMAKDGTPVGGKWSFEEDNRNKLPKNISIPKFPKISETKHTVALKKIVDKKFPNTQVV